MKEWYQIEKEEVLQHFQVTEAGLAESAVTQLREQYGYNELPKHNKDNLITIFFRELKDPIVLILLVTIVFSFLIGETIDAVAIIFIVMIDLCMGTFQEWKARKNAEALSNMIKVNAKVMRSGKEEMIDSKLLVPGDIVLLESGDKLSADVRILECRNLQIDESILTGESLAVLKQEKIVDSIVPLAERMNMAYAGTAVVTGRGMAVVVATAIQTEIGKIADKVTQTKEEKSPLTIRMEKFSKQISVLIVLIALIIAAILFMKGVDRNSIFLSVIALSVSAMPEGLPLALTMALTIASNRMAKKNVIVKKLNAVESLGSCTVIASDKTGTLTVNEQTAKKIVFPDGSFFEIGGTGYNDRGNIFPSQDAKPELASFLGTLGVLNNEAKLEQEKGKWTYFGDSIDIALLALGKKLKINPAAYQVVSSIPYESENQYSALFYQYNGKTYCTIKGSLEKILSFTTTMGGNLALDRDLLKDQNESLAKDGYRIIAFANGIVSETETYDEKSIKNLDFVGMVAFIDPVREEVKESLEEARRSGIKVVMITGDHPLTAFSIAKELALATSYDEVATGADLEQYLQKGDAAFDQFIQDKRVFSRVTPLDKLAIVESYKRQGEFIAVTGDGVNDAPALRSANIGIAMGSGTDVAKETASMIIIDDNFKSIVAGIKEGRNAYSNIRKVSYMLLSCGFAEVFFFVLSIIFNLPMPLVAIQLLWLNVVTDGLQDLALSFEKAEKGIMKEKPRRTTESLFNKDLIGEVLMAGVVIGAIVFGTWVYLLRVVGMDVNLARGYIMALMVFIQNMHVLNCRSERESTFKISIRSNIFIVFSILSAIVLQIIVMEVDFFSQFLETSTIPWTHLLYLFLFSTIILWVMEVYKLRKRAVSKPS